MKKILTFIPLGIGISAFVIYVLNLVNFRVVNNSLATLQILSNLKIYLYISIAGFVVYFLMKILEYIKFKNIVVVNREESNEEETIAVNEIPNNKPIYEPFEIENNIKEDIVNLNEKNYLLDETLDIPIINVKNKYCFNCGEELSLNAKFCTNCGIRQEEKRKGTTFIRKLINLIEIIILLLIIYFSLNMLFDYKEKTDPNFKSPFKVNMTK